MLAYYGKAILPKFLAFFANKCTNNFLIISMLMVINYHHHPHFTFVFMLAWVARMRLYRQKTYQLATKTHRQTKTNTHTRDDDSSAIVVSKVESFAHLWVVLDGFHIINYN